MRREARDRKSGMANLGNFNSSSQLIVIGPGQIIPQGGARAFFLRRKFVHGHHMQYTVKGLAKCVSMERV